MGSLIKTSKNFSAGMSRSYSLAKQRTWHYVGNGQQPPAPNKIGAGELVCPEDYCHVEASALYIL